MRHVRDTVPGCRRGRKRRSGLDSGQSPRGHGFGPMPSRHRGARAGERFRASAVAADARGGPWRAQVARRRLGRGARCRSRQAPRHTGSIRPRKVSCSRTGAARLRISTKPSRAASARPTSTATASPAPATRIRPAHPFWGLDRGRLVIDYRDRTHRAPKPQRAGGAEPLGSRGHHRSAGQRLQSDGHGRPRHRQRRQSGHLLPRPPRHRLRHEPCGAARADFGKAL